MDEQAEYSVLSKAAYDFFHGGEALAQSELQEYDLDPVTIGTGARVPFCQAFPELCSEGS